MEYVLVFVATVILCSIGSVGAQVISCRPTVDCSGTNEVGIMTAEECCVGNANGLAYTGVGGGEVCTPCIVFGFFEDSFTGVEQGPSYSVMAGFQKGAAQSGANLIFDVVNTGITATEGSGFDYTVSTNQVRFLYRRPDPPETITFIFRTDAIAQEDNETLSLELVTTPGTNAPPSGDGIYFSNTIYMTIVDSDSVEIFFTEDDFRANENPANNPDGTGNMPVRVIKTQRIANPIVLDVIPLIVGDANRDLLAAEVPANNPFAPPYADLEDFDNTVIRITFDPDETTADSERGAPIPVVNDLINEADEQVFIVELHLISSTNPDGIGLTTRPAAICRIINDDTIRIGFELPMYTYMEPMFEEQIDEFYIPPDNSTNGPVFLLKEDGVVSEQTFLIIIEVSEATPPDQNNINRATITEDFTSADNFVVQFRPSQQRLDFQFTLLPDIFPEGTESFLATSAPEDSVEVGGVVFQAPAYLPPATLYDRTYVIIEDDDPVIIGFEETLYTVNESVGIFDVYVTVFNPPVGVELFATVDLTIQTVSINATGGADYEELSAAFGDILLRFDDVDRRQVFSVTIIDDVLFEFVEEFNLELRFDLFGGATAPSGVILRPDVANVRILDDDEVTIGFLNTAYSVFENIPQVELEVGVLEGSLEREVTVSLSTSDLTALGGSDYTGISNLRLTFGPSTPSIDIPVDVLDDSAFELTKMFGASLSFPGDPVPRVTLSPASAQVTIFDEDVLTFGFEPVAYSVNEGAGSVALSVVFSGDAGAFVPHVITSTVDGTATGSGPEADYVSIAAQQLSFTNSERNRDLTVQILSDTLTELSESFSAILSSVFIANAANGPAINLSPQESSRLVLNPDTADVMILDDDVPPVDTQNCEITEPLSVKTYSVNTRYSFLGTCEHVATSLCDSVPGYNVRVTVDFLTESMENGAVGLHINDLYYVSREDGSFHDGGQTPAVTGMRYEYDATSPTRVVVDFGVGVTNITFIPNGAVDADIEIVHTYGGENPSIQIGVRAAQNMTEFCGLCGSRLGELLRLDGSVADRTDMAQREAFARSYEVEPRDQILRPQRRECGTIRNDTVIGDPLYAAPVYSEDGKEYSLCYEVFGRVNSTLNLVSDTCVSVNARYSPMDNPEMGNIISSIGVRAKGEADNSCHNIRVDLAGCSATIDSPGGLSTSLSNMESFQQDGISVRKYPRRVRISAPNCENVQLVMWVICETQSEQDMIKFVIARGVNLRASSHGLLGQFWNVPVTFTKYSGNDLPEWARVEDYYIVTVEPESSPARSFLGEFYYHKWDKSQEDCLYVGNAQGGASYEVEDPNDSVIEGKYHHYIIPSGDLFETTYVYEKFEEERC